MMSEIEDFVFRVRSLSNNENSAEDEISYTKEGHEISYTIESNSFWYRHRNFMIYSLIRQFNIRWLLDVGGGTGFVSLFLNEKGINTILLEPEMSGINIAKSRGIKFAIHGSIKVFEDKDLSVPSIGMFDVLEHIDNDRRQLKLCHNLLEPNGLIIITVPAYTWLWSSFDINSGHKRRYTKSSLNSLLNDTDFEVIKSGYMFYFLPALIWIKRKWFKPNYTKNPQSARESEHLIKSVVIGKIMMILLSVERFLVFANLFMPFGSTCVIIARKKTLISN